MSSHEPVISPALDQAIVDATRSEIIGPLRAEGHDREFVAAVARDHLAEQIAAYAEHVDPDYDPTDAELATGWSGPGAAEAHRAAWHLHQELHS